MVPIVIFIAFCFVWYFPVWKGQGKTDRLPKGTVAKAIGIGLVPAFLVIILLQIGFGYLERALPLSPVARTFSTSYISAALVEEGVKFLGAYLIIRKTCPKRKVDYVLIFGAVGLGYEVVETLLLLGSIVAGIGRGVFALHIIWQFFMGSFFWEYRKAKENNDRRAQRRSLILAFAVPVILHGTNDFLAFMAESGAQNVDEKVWESFTLAKPMPPEMMPAVWWFAALLVFMLFEIVFQIMTFKMALASAKESRMADNNIRRDGTV